MSDLSDLSDEELLQQYAQVANASRRPQAVTHDPLISYRREYIEDSPEWQQKYGPLNGMSQGAQVLAGTGQGMTNVVRHAGNLVGLESDQELKDAKALDAPLTASPAGKLGSMLGENAVLTPFSLGSGMALGAAPSLGNALTRIPGVGNTLASIPNFVGDVAANPFGRGAIEGGLQGGLMSDPGQRLFGLGAGALTGSVLPAMGAGGRRLMYGATRTPEAQELMDRGVRLTPGQMNPNGVLNKVEENIRSVPVVGNVIEHARAGAQRDFQRGVIQEAAAPGHQLQSTSHDTNELFQEAQDSYKPFYDAAKGYPVNVGTMTNMDAGFARAAADRSIGAERNIREKAKDFLDGQMEAIGDKATNSGGWQSDHLVELRSRINEEIRDAGVDSAGKSYRKLLQGARDEVTNALNSTLPQDAAQKLQIANDAYPKLAIIRDAIKRGGDQPEGFSPAQLSQAVKAAAENNEYARGGGMLRDWSAPGRDIFTQRNPQTGASHGTTGALAGAAYALHHFVPGAQIPAAVGATGYLGMVGTPFGRRLAAGQTPGQQFGQRLIEALQSGTTPSQRELAGAASRTALNRAIPAYLLRSSSSGADTTTP